MLIGYRPQGSGSYTTLGDDTASDVISGFVPRMTGVAQVVPLFMSAAPFVAARGNRQWQISGVIEHVEATVDLALAYIQSQAAALADYLDLKIVQGSKTIYFTPVVLTGFDPVISGASVRCTYSFTAGTITTTAP